MENMIELKKITGEVFKAELISYFELVSTHKKYIFYTLNEAVENGLIKMYVAELCADGATISQNMTNEEWVNLKTIMKSMLTGNADSNVAYLKWEEK